LKKNDFRGIGADIGVKFDVKEIHRIEKDYIDID